MRLPLLVGARPKHLGNGPVIKLGSGRWAIVMERVNDSTFSILKNGNSPTPLPCVVEGPCDVRIRIDTRGSEEYINIFAESQKDA